MVGLRPFFSLHGCVPRLSIVSSCMSSRQKCLPYLSVCHLGLPVCNFPTLSSSLSAPGMPMIPPWRLPRMHQLRKPLPFMGSLSELQVFVSIEANLKACGPALGRLVPIPLMGCSGIKIFPCSVRSSTLGIITSQRGSPSLPNLRPAFRPGLGVPCPFRAKL